MAAAAGLSVTLVPVLMGYWIRGPLPAEQRNPLNRGLIRVYRPALEVTAQAVADAAGRWRSCSAACGH
jgi:Cu/Ag efflux pump CusA